MLNCFNCVWFCATLPGSSVHGILHERILNWVAMPSFRRSSWPEDQTHISFVSCIGRQVLHHCAIWEAPTIGVVNFICMSLKRPRFHFFFFLVSGIANGLDRSKLRLPESLGRKFTSQGLGREKRVPPRRTCSLRVWILKRCWSSWHYVNACAKPAWKGEKSPILVILGALRSSVSK